MENPKKLPTYAIVLLCIFYPFGLLYLLFIQIRKLRTQPEEYKKTNTILTAIAAFLIFSGVFYLISGVTGQVEADPDSGAPKTTYFVTFHKRDGNRVEMEVPGEDYGICAEGDEGILVYSKGDEFIVFKRT